MSPDLRERAVKSPAFEWLDGMLMVPKPKAIGQQPDKPFDGRFAVPYRVSMNGILTGRARALGDLGYLPALGDAGTQGCLLKLVRRASGDPRAYVMHSSAVAAWVLARRGRPSIESYDLEGGEDEVLLLAIIKTPREAAPEPEQETTP